MSGRIVRLDRLVRTRRGREVLHELTEGLGAVVSVPVPEFELRRPELRQGIGNIEGAWRGLKGKDYVDVAQAFSLGERVALAARWTGGVDGRRALTYAEIARHPEFVGAVSFRLASNTFNTNNLLSQTAEYAHGHVREIEVGEWNGLLGAYRELQLPVASMVGNLPNLSDLNPLSDAIANFSMPQFDVGVSSLGAFAGPMGSVIGAGVGLLVKFFKNLFSAPDPEPAELHKWLSGRFRYRRQVTPDAAGCIVTAECQHCSCGGVSCGRGYVPGVGCLDCGSLAEDPPRSDGVQYLNDPKTKGKWIAWWNGGFGPHQRTNRFPSSPPWYSDTLKAMLDGVATKAEISGIRALRSSASDELWPEAAAKAVETVSRLSKLGVPKVDVDTLMWLYWFMPLPDGFAQVIAVDKSWQDPVTAEVRVTFSLPDATDQALREPTHGGRPMSEMALAAILGGTGAWLLLSD
jgi:hypothetical protein